MKLDPRLPQLPSLGELLEHPRLKSVVARINHSTAAKRASGWLDELRTSLVERAGKFEVPSVAQMAEALARRLVGEPPSGEAVVNATGVVLGDARWSQPLAEQALHAVMQVGGEYSSRETEASVERELCEQTGAEAAALFSTFDAALLLAVASTAAHKELLVVGGETHELSAQHLPFDSPSVDWQRLAATAGTILRTGDPAGAGAGAAAKERSARIAAIVLAPEASLAASESPLAPLMELSRHKGDGVAIIDAAPWAGLDDVAQYGLGSAPTIQSRLAAGADLVVADGAGLLTGPACGVVLGKRERIEALRNHPLASAMACSPLSVVALNATLRTVHEHGADAALYLPTWQLLSAPRANLQQRAERLAALIAAGPNISAAEARSVESAWARCGAKSLLAPSWAIAVRPRSHSAEELAQRWLERPRPIAANVSGEELLLDLRSVFPRWDQQLVAAAIS